MFNIKKYVEEALYSGGPVVGHVATFSKITGLSCTPLSLLAYEDGDGELCLLCATDQEFVHSRNIAGNPDAVISLPEGMQLTCHASILGCVRDAEWAKLRELYKEKYPEEWTRYSEVMGQVFIRFYVCHMKIWRYLDDLPYQGWFDVNLNKTVVQQYKPEHYDPEMAQSSKQLPPLPAQSAQTTVGQGVQGVQSI